MKYLEDVAKTGAKESETTPWQPLLPINDPPIINQLTAIHTGGIGEIALLNYCSRSVWEYTQEHKSLDKEIPVEAQPFALMRSNIGDQMALFIQIYSNIKPPATK